MVGETQRIYSLIINATGSKAGAEQYKRAADLITDASAKAALAFKPINDNIAAAQKAYTGLVARIDPVAAAQRRMAKELNVLQRAFEAQLIPIEEVETRLQQIMTRYDVAVDRAKKFGQGLDGAQAASRRFGSSIQNAGFQIGDFAVQVASGQGFLRPLIQQGTQFISMFGPWGAVLGAAGAVVGALATSFLGLEDSTKKATAAEEAHSKALEKSRDLYKGIRGEIEQTSQMRTAELRTIVEQAEAENRAAQAKLAATPQFSSPRLTLGSGKQVAATPNPAFKVAQQEADAALTYVRQQRAILDAALDEYDARIQKSFAAKPAEVEATATKTKTITTTTKAVTGYTKAAEDLDSKLNGLLSTMNLMAPGEAQIELAFEQGKISAEEYRKALEAIDSVDHVQKSDPAKRINSAAAATKEAANATMNWSSAISTFGNAFTSAMDLASGSGSKLSGTIREIVSSATQLLDVGFQLYSMFSGGGGSGSGGGGFGGLGSYLFGAPTNSRGFRMTGAGPGASANTSGLFSNGGWNPLNGITSWFQNLFADGGVMSPRGPVPLRRYAAGGVANSPQMSMFGEGDRPEAYVPLNDGRSIPVTLNGQGGAANRNNGQWGGNVISFSPVYSIDARGAAPGTAAQLRFEMQRIAEASVNQLRSNVNSGGGDARIFGRRRK